ncbi:hypothetical protein GTU99_29610, partial [Streptomyces sp. PRKS01-65]|nr:hypothetical protein [Streptomyces harenosi]
MESSGTSTLLRDAVQDLATNVASALRGGGHGPVAGDAVTAGAGDGLAVAAARVLGADLMLPHVLYRTPPAPGDLAVFRQAVEAH